MMVVPGQGVLIPGHGFIAMNPQAMAAAMAQAQSQPMNPMMPGQGQPQAGNQTQLPVQQMMMMPQQQQQAPQPPSMTAAQVQAQWAQQAALLGMAPPGSGPGQ